MGKDHLEIIRGMERVAVMPDVAGIECLEIDPAQEGKDTDEKGIERLGLENRTVPQLMHRVNQKGADGAVQKKQRHDYPGWPMPGPVENRAAREH